MLNSSFFREHWRRCHFRKNHYKLCKFYEVAEHDSSDDRKTREWRGIRSSGWVWRGKCNEGISYLRLKNLPQIRSRVPGKLPKTIPTTTVTTATSEKTTQNFELITRQFAWSQAIIAQSKWSDSPVPEDLFANLHKPDHSRKCLYPQLHLQRNRLAWSVGGGSHLIGKRGRSKKYSQSYSKKAGDLRWRRCFLKVIWH